MALSRRDSRGVRTLTNDSQGEEYTGEWEIVTGANFLRKYQNTVILTFTSAQIIIDHANSKIHMFKISQFSFSRNQHGREKAGKFAPCQHFPLYCI